MVPIFMGKAACLVVNTIALNSYGGVFNSTKGG